jgi:uncharacterized protein YukE
MFRRIVALVLVLALTLTLVPVKITNTVEAAMVDDPLDAAIAPHFSRVVYTLTEPSYSTSCDERGDFKALVGTPEISISDSRLVVTPISSTKSSAVLSKTDVPELNQTRAYYEMSFSVSNTLSWTNISLYDLPNDWINISVHSGAFVYDYDSGTRQLGTFYSPAAAGVDYVIAFDLTSSSVTIFLYGTNGTLLADKYISSNLLVAGDLDEIRFELQGSTSNALRLDYLYVLGSTTLPGATSITLGLEQINPDDLAEEKRIDLDPTSITLDQSLRQDLFAFEDVELDKRVTDREVLNAIGQTDIHQQRAAGRLVAEGYKDLQSSVEDALISYIANAEKVEIDQVYLIDYYMDYLQCEVKVDNKIVDKLVNEYQDTVGPLTSFLGGTLVDANTATAASIPARVSNISLTDPGLYIAPLPYIALDMLRGLGPLNDPFGIKSNQKYWQDLFAQMYGDTQNRLDLLQNQTFALFENWQRSTDEKFQQVRQDFLNFISISTAQTAQLASAYSEMQDKFERTISKFFSYTQNQFEATNAIIAKLLLQNELFANASQETTRYFAGQLANTNEVIMNLTSQLTNALTGQDFWKSVYSDGKPQSEPLTFSGFFGNNMKEIVILFVFAFITIVVALVLIILFRKPKRTTRTARR